MWNASVIRAAAIAVGAVLVLGLAACGGGDGSSTTTATTNGTSGAGDPSAGRDVFLSQDCGTCHILSEAGTTGATGPNLDESLPLSSEAAGAQLEDHVRTGIVDPDAFVMPQFSGGVMPTDYGSRLSETELNDLVAFIVSTVE